MSCLSVDVKLLRNPLVLSTERIGGISANVSLASVPLVLKIADAARHLSVRCSIVCSIKELHNYLKVSPKEIQWITPEYGIVYNVESDLDWIIVTS